jgi:tetratricopeptide (TPR) repeat protein
MILLALAASLQVANAQTKDVADAKKALASAVETSQNPKKAAKAATWMKLGDAYVAAYSAPASKVWNGATKQELSLVMGETPKSTEQVNIGGQAMSKEVYEEKDLYFNSNGQLVIIDVTKPIDKDALAKAVEAYEKAEELGGDAKKISQALTDINQKYVNDAYNDYQLGRYAESSIAFENAAKTLAAKPLNQLDTNAIYNAGFTAWQNKDNARAEKFFQTCLDNNYYGEDGEVYVKLADIDTVNAKSYLEKGFSAFPQSQGVLIGLINYYIKHNEDPEKLFVLLDKAKENEPNNASLYYVEGNIRAQLKDYDKAVTAYEQCAKIDPKYEFGYIGEGVMYYNLALDLQKQAQDELDDKKYEAIVDQFTAALKNCIDPFEKAYATTTDEGIKLSVAEYLKNAYYRFASESEEYKNAYDKYNAIVKNGTTE